MAEAYIGEIRIFAGNFAPKGWALCNGQLMSIAQNTALYSILGLQYGGDGKTTFALPNLQGNVPMFWGQGPGDQHVLDQSARRQDHDITRYPLQPSITVPAHTPPGGDKSAVVPDEDFVEIIPLLVLHRAEELARHRKARKIGRASWRERVF